MSSFLNAVWDYKNPDSDLITTLSAELNISELLVRILINRGFTTPEAIRQIFDAKLKTTIPDSSLFLDMNAAIERVTQAVLNKENVAIFGDYDVDGITSTCLLIKILKRCGLNPSYYIPSRLKDGYGLSKDFIRQNQDKQLIIVVDSGIGAIEEVELACSLGVDIVIFDHHAQLADKIPNAVAVVNPNRIDQSEISYSQIKSLCAAGVVFVFLVYLMQHFKKIGRSDLCIDMINYVDLAAMGTIGDLVSLTGINRALVKYLIHSQKICLGIRQLMSLLNIQEINSIEEVTYYISPSLNAAGRMGKAEVAVELILAETKETTLKKASELIILNTQRKAIEKQNFEEALILAEKIKYRKVICVFGNKWHEGVIGIISGKLREKYQKPTFAIAFDDNGQGRGSARSVPGLHIGQLINKAVNRNILIGGGGHEMAGGLSIQKDKIDAFISFLEAEVPDKLIPSLPIDYVLTPQSPLKQIEEEINKLAPFGPSMPKPIFAIKRCLILDMRFANDNFHIRFLLADECQRGRLKAILFHSYMNKEFEQLIISNRRSLFDIIGSISYSPEYGPSFIIKDIQLSGCT